MDGSQLSDIEHPRLQVLDAYIRKHHATPITLTVAAKVATLSPAYLSALVRRELNITFVQWVTVIRVEAAKPLLKRRWPQITQVASQVGFPSLIAFERAFRRSEGLCPREFRKKHARERKNGA